MMSRLHNFERLTALRGWCVVVVRLGHTSAGIQAGIYATTPPAPAASPIGGSLLPKRYPSSFMDLGSQEANR